MHMMGDFYFYLQILIQIFLIHLLFLFNKIILFNQNIIN